MKRYFSPITAQHAPTPWASRQAVVSGWPLAPSGTDHTACRTPQSNKLTASRTIRMAKTMVAIEESIEPNRLWRTQATGP